jgi:membrane protease YdiL (CAAX protease family)
LGFKWLDGLDQTPIRIGPTRNETSSKETKRHFFMNGTSISPTVASKKSFPILATLWLVIDLLILLPVQNFLGGSFPLFTVIWLLPPLIALLASKDSGKIGIRRVPVKTFLTALGLNGVGVFLVMLLCEPWSHTYQALIIETLKSTPPDPTFAWLLRFRGWPGAGLMFLYSFLVSMFAEELFFRGWLLQWLGRRLPAVWAILLQAFLFTLPQAIVAFFLAPIQAVVYVACYSFLAIGGIGGWAAWRTKSIWPSLITASLMNLIIVMVALPI